MDNKYTATVITFTSPTEYVRNTVSDYSMSDLAENKHKEGYSYNWILGHFLFLRKDNFPIDIMSVLDDTEKKHFLEHEASEYGTIWESVLDDTEKEYFLEYEAYEYGTIWESVLDDTEKSIF